ncbi:MAG: DUF58 domain-containing protein [Tetrasphaera sp.]
MTSPVQAVTPLGWTAILGGLAATAVGMLQGWAEARLIGIAAVTAAAIALLLTIGNSRYRASLEIERPRARIGERVLGRVEVSNSGKRPLVPVRIELPVGAGLASFDIPALATGATHEALFSVPTKRRGVITIGPTESVRRDPLGLIERTNIWPGQHDLCVHPDTVTIDATASGLLRDVEGVPVRRRASSDVTFDAVRDYVPGDDRRAVHWRTTARMGRLMVRQFEETHRSHLVVLLSLRPEDYAAADDVELAVSVAASLCLQAQREGRVLSVRAGALVLPTGSPAALLDRFAAVQPHPDAPRARQQVNMALATEHGASIVAVVTGSALPHDELRAVEQLLPADLALLVFRCGVGAATERHRHGECVVIDVGALADLPRAARSLR